MVSRNSVCVSVLLVRDRDLHHLERRARNGDLVCRLVAGGRGFARERAESETQSGGTEPLEHRPVICFDAEPGGSLVCFGISVSCIIVHTGRRLRRGWNRGSW
jgi:hypothetical protein